MSQWKRPDEILQLQRLKQKQKALQARIQRPSGKSSSDVSSSQQEPNPFAGNQKRKNPFSINDDNSTKKHKSFDPDLNNDESILELLHKTTPRDVLLIDTPVIKPLEPRFLVDPQHQLVISTDQQKAPEIQQKPSKHLPIHWGIKSRLRIVCKSSLPGNNLRTNQEASGLTSFVRCIGIKDSSVGLDISPGARFYQSTLYWQHPHLPWLTLFPRNSKSNHGIVLGEVERVALGKEWAVSFQNLFQLVRSRQCPYFYVCANSFTVLFRAAGIGGRVETHALLTPTSRGMRLALKQEDIEFSMPLKKTPEKQELNRSAESGISVHNGSFSNSSEEQSTNAPTDEGHDEEEDDDDMEEEKWLESLGVEADEIKKINYNQSKKLQSRECDDDYSDQSTVLIEGVECQAFFNFLLNAKSSTAKVGRLAGVPPTLIAPVAFVGATLRTLTTRSSKIRMDGEDYHSTELQGVILPHVLPYICGLLTETKDNFSTTLVTVPNTTVFSRVSQKIIDDADKENEATAIGDQVLWKENLSDSGLSEHILETMCRASKDSVNELERLVYCKEEGGYTWS
ncbi:protein downstream neighbor of son homolog [Ochlerotatus camptorhynchus]|uniref:protein downstream neighbor of son homolog n=1 Tax=Ochlerotatus camptorhynchus TaxID=644619 RepID=UPI0031D038A0